MVDGWTGFQVRWDGNDGVYVRMTKAYKDKTCGLCGNYNDDGEDDFIDSQVNNIY